ncbi:MAG TPA: biopolymer transporter ExbD [Coleofasciculaceae cyanobacterium]|jgi:biopolymer transport protein ExbD/biopolymer transport protein TolR
MRASGRKQVFNEINITPLTDIFLVLLIIMIVVAPMLDTTGLKVSVPTVGPSEDVKEEPKTIELKIAADGAYTIEGKAVNRMMLGNTLRGEVKGKPDGVIIKTNPEASHEALTYAMDEIQGAGITKVAVMANDGEGDASPDGQ